MRIPSSVGKKLSGASTSYSGFHMSIDKIRLLKCFKNLDLITHGQLKTAMPLFHLIDFSGLAFDDKVS